jgi:hypothetical protein
VGLGCGLVINVFGVFQYVGNVDDAASQDGPLGIAATARRTGVRVAERCGAHWAHVVEGRDMDEFAIEPVDGTELAVAQT